jgi:hypothetical protein
MSVIRYLPADTNSIKPITSFSELIIGDVVLISGRRASVLDIRYGGSSVEVQYEGFKDSTVWVYPLSLPKMFKLIADEMENIPVNSITNPDHLEIGDEIGYINEKEK